MPQVDEKKNQIERQESRCFTKESQEIQKGDAEVLKRPIEVLVGLALFAMLTVFFYFASLSLTKSGPAPEIISLTWINSDPLRMEDLRGKVVMVEFWTFGCWNCRNMEPYVKEWHEKYAEEGLVVIAVHSPEFKYEEDVEKVKDYIREHQIPYAVPIDNEFRNWRQYRNRYWPTLYLIDKRGEIQYTKIGEGGYEKTERILKQLLAELA